MRKRVLLVTADDLGYSSVRDEGILNCFRKGLVTRASLMVNGMSASTAAALANEAGLPLGLHLNLTEGVPISSPEKIPSLVRFTNGKWCFKGVEPIFDDKDGTYICTELEMEIIAQIQRFKELTGNKPFYVDGHNHVNILEPVARSLARVLHENAIHFTRIPCEIFMPKSFWSSLSDPKKQFYSKIVSQAEVCRRIYLEYNVKPNADSFIGIGLMGKFLNEVNLSDCLFSIPSVSGSVELMVHPGNSCPQDGEGLDRLHGCGVGPDSFSQSLEREKERDFLCAASTRHLIEKDHELNLSSFANDESLNCIFKRERERTVVILSSLTLATGNLITVKRISGMLQANGACTMLLNPYQISSPQVMDSIIKVHNVSKVLGINAKRVGGLLKYVKSEFPSIGTVLITGGTDVNSDKKEPFISKDALEGFASVDLIVSFNADMKRKVEEGLLNEGFIIPRILVAPQSFQLPCDFESLLRSSPFQPNLRLHCGCTGILLILPAGLRPVKDPAFLFDAINNWNSKEPQNSPRAITLVVVGPVLDKDFADSVIPRCQDLLKPFPCHALLHPKIFYCDAVPQRELLSMVIQADGLVNSSKNEGMSNAILEAMALRRPVFARKNAGNCSVVSHLSNGFLFTSPEEFVDLVVSYLDASSPHPALNAIIERASTYLKEQFSTENEAEVYQNILLDVV